MVSKLTQLATTQINRLKVEVEMDWLNRKAQAMININSVEFEGSDGTLIREPLFKWS